MTYRTDWKVLEEASYVEPLQPHLRDNPLIEALQPMRADADLFRALRSKPPFHADQRSWDTYQRLPMLHTLSDFMVPMQRHISFARYVETILRHGYIGRGPNTKRHVDVLQQIHHLRQEGPASDLTQPTHASLTAAFVGLSGTAKTTIIRIVSRLFPRVIYHPGLRIWQVPILRTEFPADGHSIKGPLLAIYKTLESWLEDADYATRSSQLKRRTLGDLPSDLAGVLHRHFVGLVVIDEVQNARHAPKDKASLAALLVQLSNVLGVPVLFVGTNQVRDILSDTMASGRRSLGLGLSYWDRYLWHDPSKDGATPPEDEWTPFFRVLWQHQWVRNPRPFSTATSAVVHDCSQGIPDVAIKLFVAAQRRAMDSGQEEVTDALLRSVATVELKPIEPMLHALRTGDQKLLEKYDDLAPLRVRDGNLDPSFGTRTVPMVRGVAVTPDSPLFEETLVDAMQAIGVPDTTSNEVAEEVAREHPKVDAVRGLQHALAKLRPPVPRRQPEDEDDPLPPLPENVQPGDLRHALVMARKQGKRVVEVLPEIGLVSDMKDLLLPR